MILVVQVHHNAGRPTRTEARRTWPVASSDRALALEIRVHEHRLSEIELELSEEQ